MEIDASALPLRDETVAAIEAAQAAGRPVYLASASPRGAVEALAARVGGIAGVFATGDGANLAGEAKAKRLAEAFGERGFDYIGDRRADFAVWRVAPHISTTGPQRRWKTPWNFMTRGSTLG